jgi:hypothetical protein
VSWGRHTRAPAEQRGGAAGPPSTDRRRPREELRAPSPVHRCDLWRRAGPDRKLRPRFRGARESSGLAGRICPSSRIGRGQAASEPIRTWRAGGRLRDGDLVSATGGTVRDLDVGAIASGTVGARGLSNSRSPGRVRRDEVQRCCARRDPARCGWFPLSGRRGDSYPVRWVATQST